MAAAPASTSPPPTNSDSIVGPEPVNARLEWSSFGPGVGVGAAFDTIVYSPVSDPKSLLTVTTNSHVPASVGEPVMIPVAGSIDSPGGNCPVVTSNNNAGDPIAVTELT